MPAKILGLAIITALGMGLAASASADPNDAPGSLKTATPIKHVIVVIGENRSFDHVFGTYVPPSRDFILNLLSEGIVQADGSPGPNFAAARQFTTSGQHAISLASRRGGSIRTQPCRRRLWAERRTRKATPGRHFPQIFPYCPWRPPSSRVTWCCSQRERLAPPLPAALPIRASLRITPFYRTDRSN